MTAFDAHTPDVAAVQADMAAGTPGPWFIVPCECGHRGCNYHGTSNGSFYQGCGYSREDARRIARLPDLEAAYIALTAELTELRRRVKWHKQALDGYRKLTDTQRAELTELRLELIATSGQAGEHHAARIAAEAERDRLRAALASEEADHRKRHVSYITSKGRDPDKYGSVYSTVADAILSALTPNTGA
jgi:hypothetical protein